MNWASTSTFCKIWTRNALRRHFDVEFEWTPMWTLHPCFRTITLHTHDTWPVGTTSMFTEDVFPQVSPAFLQMKQAFSPSPHASFSVLVCSVSFETWRGTGPRHSEPTKTDHGSSSWDLSCLLTISDLRFPWLGGLWGGLDQLGV